MSKNLSTAMLAHCAQPSQTLCSCLMFTRTDGTVFRFTDHDTDLVISGWSGASSDPAPSMFNGTYVAAVGYTMSDVASNSDLSADNLQPTGILNSPSLTDADLAAGLWDFAQFSIFLINRADLTATMGCIRMRDGWMGEVTVDRFQWKADLDGMMKKYATTIGRIYTPMCDANLGDARCKVRLDPPIWQPNTAYAVISGAGDASIGSIVSPTAPNGFIFYCGTAGVSGATEPAWTLISGGVTVDGTAVWQSFPALTVTGAVASVSADGFTIYDPALTQPGPPGGVAISGITQANPGVVTLATTPSPPFTNQQLVTISGVLGMINVNAVTVIHSVSGNTFQLAVDTGAFPAYISGGVVTPFGASGFFDFGILKMTSGLNAGLSMEVKSYVPGQLTLFLPFPYAVAPGDTYVLSAGCDKGVPTCRDRFFNILNNRSFPYIPGLDKIVQVGRQPANA